MSPIRVLLADDHAVVRAGIRKVVEELPDLEVVGEVGDGPALFAELESLAPDCLLIDVAMPDFKPVDSIRKIRAEYPSIKILVVSAYDDDIYVNGLLGAGVNGYHLKDQPLSDLQLALTRVLAGELWLSTPLISKLVRPGVNTPALNITRRQRELLRLLWQGLDNQSIANLTGLSIKTIENHLTRLYRQLRVQSRLEAVNFLVQHPEVLGISGEETPYRPEVVADSSDLRVSLLVVDDNPRYRLQLKRLIGRVCPHVVIYEAGNIAEAVYLSQRLNPQLVLIDVVLGDEDGIGCARRIKAVSALSRIVLISAYPDREFHRLGLAAGAVAFLDKKDLDARTLRHVIEDLSG